MLLNVPSPDVLQVTEVALPEKVPLRIILSPRHIEVSFPALTITAGFMDKINESTKAKHGAPPGLSVVAKRVADPLLMSLDPGK